MRPGRGLLPGRAVSVTADATATWRFKIRQIGSRDSDFYFTDVRVEEVASLTATMTVEPRVLLTS